MRLVTRSCLALLSFAAASPVFAQASTPVTGNVALFTQYVFRGLTQTNRKPALQGGFDYTHASGFYAGIWGSNVSWVSDTAQSLSPSPGSLSSSIELDTYLGFRGSFASDWSYDIGYLRYNYPGSYPAGYTKPDTDEIYGQLGWKWITFKASDSISNKTFGVSNSRNTYYLDLTATIPLNEKITLTLHAGKQKFKGSGNDIYSYNDYKVELATTFAKDWTAGVGGTNTNAKDSGYTLLGRNIGDDQFYAFIKKTF